MSAFTTVVLVLGFVLTTPVFAAETVSITLTSQETLWIDANKASTEGPAGAWLSFVIENTGDNTLEDLTVTFAGFTGTNAAYFEAPSDLVRSFSALAPGDVIPVYYYVDYSEVFNHPHGGGTTYDDYTANYTISVASPDLDANPTVYNGTVTTDELLTANAAGIAESSTLGPGTYVGQILEQYVTYSFGNNSDLFFQPAGDLAFKDECIRLVGSEITAVTGNVDSGLVGEKDRLHYPTASVAGGGGTITITYYWEILCTNIAQTAHPWAAALSGAKYKYTGFAASQIYPDAELPLTMSKSVDPTYLETPTSDGGYGAGIVEYTVVFTNDTLVQIVLSEITDVLPAGVEIEDSTATGSEVTAANSSSVPATGATGTVTWSGKSLGYRGPSTYVVPAEGTLTLVYTVDVSNCTYPAYYTNSAEGAIGNTTVGPDTSTFGIGIAPEPELSASKSDVLHDDADSNGVPSPGDTLRYTVVITNSGNADATGVTFTDTPDSNTTLVSGSVTTTQGSVTTGNTGGDSNVDVNVGTISSDGSSATITFDVTIDDPLPAGVDEVDNQGTVSSTELDDVLTDDPDVGGDEDPTETPVTAAPVLSASKTDSLQVDDDSDGVPSPGDTLRYTIVVTNNGNIAATNVTFTDTPDANTTLVSSSVTTSQGTVTGGNAGTPPVTVDVGTIAGGGGSATITFDVTIDDPLSAGVDRVQNQGIVRSDDHTPVLTDDSDVAGDNDPTETPVTAAPVLSASKTDVLHIDDDSNGVPSPGDTLRYTIVITNSGNANATFAYLNDNIDPNLTLVSGSVTTTQGTVTGGNAGTPPVTVDVGTISGGGGTVTVTFDAVINDPLPAGVDRVQNQGIISSDDHPQVLTDDPAIPGDEDPTQTPVTASPVLSASKTDNLSTDADGDGVPSPGDTLLYSVTLTNNGNTAATGVTFTDIPDANTSLVPGSVSTSQGTVAGGNTGTPPVTVDVGTIAGGGGSVTISFEVTVHDPLPAGVNQIDNQGTVSSTELDDVPTDDPDLPGGVDPTITPVTAVPLLSASKADILSTDADGNGVPSPGDTLLYTVTLINSGNAAASGITFTDTPDSNTSLVAGSVQTSKGTVTGGNDGTPPVTVDVGTIAGGGGSVTISFEVTIHDPLPAAVNQVDNQGTLSSNELDDVLTDDPDTDPGGDPTNTPIQIAEEPPTPPAVLNAVGGEALLPDKFSIVVGLLLLLGALISAPLVLRRMLASK